MGLPRVRRGCVRIPHLQPGPYELTAELQGFKNGAPGKVTSVVRAMNVSLQCRNVQHPMYNRLALRKHAPFNDKSGLLEVSWHSA